MAKRRSVLYRLSGRPRNDEDLIDWVSAAGPVTIDLRLRRLERAGELRLVSQLLAGFRVSNHRSRLAFDRICGGYMDTQSRTLQAKAVAAANTQVRDLVQRLRELGVTVIEHQTAFPAVDTPEKEHREMNPYQRFKGHELILRDELAIDRTVLANERTLLSYLRTGLALALTGGGIIRFFEATPGPEAIGIGLIAIGGLVSILGVHRFVGMDRRIRIARTQSGPTMASVTPCGRESPVVG